MLRRSRFKPSDNRKAMLGKLSSRVGALESLGVIERTGRRQEDGDANKLANWGRSRWSLAGDADLWSAIWGALGVLVVKAQAN